MAAVATAQTAKAIHPGAYDRVFYTTLSLVMALRVMAGFGSTYFSVPFRLALSGTAPWRAFAVWLVG